MKNRLLAPMAACVLAVVVLASTACGSGSNVQQSSPVLERIGRDSVSDWSVGRDNDEPLDVVPNADGTTDTTTVSGSSAEANTATLTPQNTNARPDGQAVRCEVSVVGDSLVSGARGSYDSAFEEAGCKATIDGVASRSLAPGTFCVNDQCSDQGLEVLSKWKAAGKLAPVVVVALGTNDALGALGATEQTWRQRWSDTMALAPGHRIVFVTPAGTGSPYAEKEAAYAASLRNFCSTNPCYVADWARTTTAKDGGSYMDRVHLSSAASLARARFLADAAKQVAAARL